MTKSYSVAAWVAVLAFGAFNPAWGAQHKPVAGGANQRASVEGCMGQTLFDGFWRLKVTSVTTADEPGNTVAIPAYAVALDLKNARALDSSPSMLGVGQPQLVLDDGTVLELSTGSEITYSNQLQFKSLAPGAGAHVLAYFRVENTTAKPSKVLLTIKRANPATKASFGYPTSDPSFRVHLDCTK